MWNPELQEAHASLANYLRSSMCLPQRDREIAILRQAWDGGADYQWAIHAEMALNAGLTADEIDNISAEPDEGEWAPHEVAIIRAVDELDSSCRVSDDTWNALAAHYDERQMIELLVLVGNYRLLAYVFNAVGIPPPGGQSPDLPGNSFLFCDSRGGDRSTSMPSEPYGGLDRLAAYEDIKQLKARYFRAVDIKDWALLSEVFAPEAVSGPNERGDVTRGREAIIERLRTALGDVETVHQGHSPEIELTSPTTARGIWAQEDRLWGFPAGSEGSLHGYGHYHDTYVKVGDGWRIASTQLVRIRVEITPPGPRS